MVRLGAQLLDLLRIGVDLDLALVDDGVVLALDLGVEHFADVLGAEARLIRRLADADADHVALAGVHDAFDAVQEAVELALEHALEVALHGLAGDLDDVRDRDLRADFELVEVRALQRDAVILDLVRFLGANQLDAVHAGAVHLDLHVLLADDLALVGGGEGDRDVDVRDLDLDIARLERGVDPVLGVGIDDQRLRHGPHVVGVVGDDREAHLDRAGAAGDGDVIDRRVGIDEREDALHGVLVEGVVIAGLGRAENHRRASDQRDDVTDRPDVRTDRHTAHAETGRHARFVDLIDDAADHKHEDAAGLIALHGLNRFFHARRRADHDDEAGDVARDQRNAQFANFRVGEVTMILGALVGCRAAGILARFDDFRRHRGSDAGGEDRLRAVFTRHHGADIGEHGLQFVQLGDLFAEVGIDAGEVIGGVGHGHGRVFAQLGDDGVDFVLRLEVHLIGATEYSIKQSHLCFHSFHDSFFVVVRPLMRTRPEEPGRLAAGQMPSAARFSSMRSIMRSPSFSMSCSTV